MKHLSPARGEESSRGAKVFEDTLTTPQSGLGRAENAELGCFVMHRNGQMPAVSGSLHSDPVRNFDMKPDLMVGRRITCRGVPFTTAAGI